MDSKRASKAGAVTFSDADLKAFWGIGDKLIDELRPKIICSSRKIFFYHTLS